tara:strand:+ start:2449 stop:3159 length:711 start_codon:yes stop_codon:yes gene_type:complete
MNIKAQIVTALLLTFLAGCADDPKPEQPIIELQPAQKIIKEALQRGGVSTIHIDQLPITDADLELIRNNPDITNLLLDESSLTDAGMKTIASLPNLIHLRVRSQVSNACIEDLLTIPGLQFLNLPFADFTDQGIAQLAKHPKIQLLRLRSPQLTDESMTSIAEMKNLAFLHLIDIPITDEGLLAFHHSDQLQSLYIDNGETTHEGLSELLTKQPMLHLHVNQAHLDSDPKKDDHDH